MAVLKLRYGKVIQASLSNTNNLISNVLVRMTFPTKAVAEVKGTPWQKVLPVQSQQPGITEVKCSTP